MAQLFSFSVIAYTCIAAMAALLQAIDNTAQPLSRKNLAESMLELKSVRVPDGAIELHERHALFPLRLQQWRGGILQDLEAP